MGIWLLQLFTFVQPTNPAAASYHPFRGAALVYDRAFGVAEWSGSAAWVGIGISAVPVEAGVSVWGSDLWRELEFRVRTGAERAPFHAGLGINHRMAMARGYTPWHQSTLDAGLAVDAGDRLRIGYLQTNLLAAPGLEAWSALEATWNPLPDWTFATGAWHRRYGPPDLSLSSIWAPRSDLVVSVGRSWDPGMWRLGIRYNFGRMLTGFSTRSHPDLGWSRTLEVVWE